MEPHKKLVVRLRPRFKVTAEELKNAGLNPKVEVQVRPSRSIGWLVAEVSKSFNRLLFFVSPNNAQQKWHDSDTTPIGEVHAAQTFQSPMLLEYICMGDAKSIAGTATVHRPTAAVVSHSSSTSLAPFASMSPPSISSLNTASSLTAPPVIAAPSSTMPSCNVDLAFPPFTFSFEDFSTSSAAAQGASASCSASAQFSTQYRQLEDRALFDFDLLPFTVQTGSSATVISTSSSDHVWQPNTSGVITAADGTRY